MKADARLEGNILDVLVCREARSFTRPLRGYKNRKIRRQASLMARRSLKAQRRNSNG
jgi:hypothetical protein